MNRMLRLNTRRSHHRIDSTTGTTFSLIRSSIRKNSEEDRYDQQMPSPPVRNRRNKAKNSESKQRSLNSLKTTKKKSGAVTTFSASSPTLRVVQSEKSFDVLGGGDTSETELTVPHVDSSFSQYSDTDKETMPSTTVSAPTTMAIPDNLYAGDCAQCDDEIFFLGNVYEYGCSDEDAKFVDDVDYPIVILALEASQKILHDANTAYTVDFSTATSTSNHGISISSSDEKRLEPYYFKFDQIGNTCVEGGDSEQAVIKYLLALHCKREALVMMQCSKPTGKAANHRKKMELKHFKEKQHILASIATSINNLAFLQHSQSRIGASETLALYQIALQIKRHVLGSQHLSVGKTLNNIGSIYYIQREFQMAAQTYEEARSILQLHLGTQHLDVCTVTANIGDVYCSMKQWTSAAKEYRSALELRWPLYGPSDPKNIRLMEQIAEIEMLINQLNARKDCTDKSGNHEKCYGPIIKDVRKLHKEVQRDIDHIDKQLESHLPMEMMKEKITVYREMRDIVMNNRRDDFGLDVDDGCFQNTNSIGRNDLESRDFIKKHMVSKECTAVTENATKSLDAVGVVIVSGKDQSTVSPTTFEAALPKLQRGEYTTTKKLSSPQLTSEERQKALITVKEKLAKLRAQREPVTPSSFLKPCIIDLQ